MMIKFRFAFICVPLCLTVACIKKTSKTDESNGAMFTAICEHSEKPEAKTCSDYAGVTGQTEETYARSCKDQKGIWNRERVCHIASGTRGCKLTSTNGGATMTTWYTGESFKTTTIDCAGLEQVTK